MYEDERKKAVSTYDDAIKSLDIDFYYGDISQDEWLDRTCELLEKNDRTMKHYDNLEALHKYKDCNKSSYAMNLKTIIKDGTKKPTSKIKVKDEKTLNSFIKYYDEAVNKLRPKVAKNFSVQFFGNCVPKNAMYFRSKNLIVYIDDYKQFYEEHRAYICYALNKKSANGRFEKSIIKANSLLYKYVMAFIVKNNMKNIKVEYQLMLNRDTKPEYHSVPEPMYRGNPRQLLTARSAEYGAGITDTDAVRTYYSPVDHKRSQKIAEQQESYKKFMYNHRVEYENAVNKFK